MRAVVTGGTGVIGRAAVSSLVAAGHDVVVVVRSVENAQVVEALGASWARGDVFDTDTLEAAYDGADCVVNLATHVPVGYAATLPRAWRIHDRLCTNGVAAVVEAARRAGVRRVVQESASHVYADQGDDWITEHSPVEVTPTTEPLAVGEAHVQEYTCGSRAGVVLRFGVVIGDDPLTRTRLRDAGRGRRIGLGHPSDWAHVVHTDDLGAAVVAALHAPSGVYNVGAEPVQRQELVQGYADAAGVDVAGFRPRRASRRLEPLARSLRVSSDHFAAQTGWHPTRPKFDAEWLAVAVTPDPVLAR